MGFIITLQTRLEYRVDFVLGVLGSIGLQTASLGTLWVLLKSMPVMAGWTAMFGSRISVLISCCISTASAC